MAFTGPNPELFHFPWQLIKPLNGGNLQGPLQTPISQPLTPVCLSLYRSNFLGDSDSYGCREKSTPS